MGVAQIVAIIFLGTVVAILVFVAVKNVASPKKIDGIQRLLKQGKTQAAIKAAKSLIQKNPKDYFAHYYLGRAYLADGKNELALMELKYVDQNGIFDGKQLPEAQFRKSIAALYSKFGQQEDALKQYLLLTKLEPNVAEHYFQVAQVYDANNRHNEAMGFYDKVLRLDKRNVKAHAAMGLLLYRAKQINEAKREIDTAIKLSPETYSTYYFLGKILKDAKDLPGAIKAFEKGQRDAEYRQKSLIEMGSCYMMGNSVENAMNCYERAISASKDASTPETVYARYFLAACFEKTRKIEKAIEQWEAISAVQKNFRDVPQKLAEYKDLQANDSLKEYLTSAESEFVEICKNTCTKAMSCQPRQVDLKKWGCQIVATDAGNSDWRSVRKQSFLLYFFREANPIEENVVLRALDELKSKNCTKAYILASSSFSPMAKKQAENRPVELVGKEALEVLLDKAS